MYSQAERERLYGLRQRKMWHGLNKHDNEDNGITQDKAYECMIKENV